MVHERSPKTICVPDKRDCSCRKTTRGGRLELLILRMSVKLTRVTRIVQSNDSPDYHDATVSPSGVSEIEFVTHTSICLLVFFVIYTIFHQLLLLTSYIALQMCACQSIV